MVTEGDLEHPIIIGAIAEASSSGLDLKDIPMKAIEDARRNLEHDLQTAGMPPPGSTTPTLSPVLEPASSAHEVPSLTSPPPAIQQSSFVPSMFQAFNSKNNAKLEPLPLMKQDAYEKKN